MARIVRLFDNMPFVRSTQQYDYSVIVVNAFLLNFWVLTWYYCSYAYVQCLSFNVILLSRNKSYKGRWNVCLYVYELHSLLFLAWHQILLLNFSFSLLTFPWSWQRQFEEHTMVNLCLTCSVTSPCNCRGLHWIFARVS